MYLFEKSKPFLWNLKFEEILNREAEKATFSKAESGFQNKMILQDLSILT